MTRRSWLTVTVMAVLTLVFIGVFKWQQPQVTIILQEPTASSNVTSSAGVYTSTQFATNVGHFQKMEAVMLKGQSPLDGRAVSLTKMPIQPGLTAAESLDVNGNASVCSTMTPQGVDIVGDYLITSAYDHDRNHNSVLFVQNIHTNKVVKTIVLQGMPHVGGISYDANHKILWVCGRKNGRADIFGITKAEISSYSFAKTHKPIATTHHFELGSISRASFITYHKHQLFIGFFNPAGTGSVQHFDVDQNGNIIGKDPSKELATNLDLLTAAMFQQKTISQVQGIVFYGGYAFLSQSYGPGNSRLFIFHENLKKTRFRPQDAVMTLKMPSHLEQISVANGRMYMVFESGAYAYRNRSTNQIDRVASMDLKALVKQVKANE